MRKNYSNHFGNNIFLLVAVLTVSFALYGCGSISHSRTYMGIPGNVVILSFDDGPNTHEDTTASLLDVLKKHNVHAMFALLGVNAEHNPALVRRIYDEGHYIINHGYSDKWASNMGAAEFRDNLLRGERAIAAALGEPLPYRLYRPQGGYYRHEHKTIWEEAGYSLVNGSVRIYDAVVPPAKSRQKTRELIKKIEAAKGGMVLLHDMRDSWQRMEDELALEPNGPFNRSWVPEMVEETLRYFRGKNYRIDGSEIPVLVEGIGSARAIDY